jgi:phospholipid/cholesterol/gamma-HCH transport system ATP-binding protein
MSVSAEAIEGSGIPPGNGVIRLDNVFKTFRGTDQVLRGISIEFERGKLTYILGSSGAGKSVMLKHILGLLKPDSGHVFVKGKDIGQMKGHKLAAHRLLFGMLFQNSALFDDMTIFDNVAFPLREHTKLRESEIAERVRTALTRLGMPKGHDKFPNELSGGMRKRVGLARAIIREPEILLYDEPTTGLDPVTRTTVDELIEQLKRELKLTSLVISHDIPSALLLADRIAFLHQGKIVFYGTPAEFKQSRHEGIQAFLTAERRTVEALEA